jgi:uncharacterized protein (DUF697 family)
MDFHSIINLAGIGPNTITAIEDGREWGNTFLRDQRWEDNKDRMANHAIYESTLWSIGNGIIGGFIGVVGLPFEVATSLYSQVKLTSALFTIYGIDTKSRSAQPLVYAAATGVKIGEVANTLATKAARKTIEKALMSLPNRTFMQINQRLGVKLISKTCEKATLNIAKIIPAVGSAVGGTVNGVMMNACGHSVKVFIKTYKSS